MQANLYGISDCGNRDGCNNYLDGLTVKFDKLFFMYISENPPIESFRATVQNRDQAPFNKSMWSLPNSPASSN